jgi:hypothetical protein
MLYNHTSYYSALYQCKQDFGRWANLGYYPEDEIALLKFSGLLNDDIWINHETRPSYNCMVLSHFDLKRYSASCYRNNKKAFAAICHLDPSNIEGSLRQSMCPPGTYFNELGNYCEHCPKGKFASGRDRYCHDRCFPGTILDTNFNCQSCVSGFYSNRSNSTACLSCEPGKYSSGYASACIECKEGRFSTFSSAKCDSCDYGKYSGQAASTCVDCSPGKYASTTESAGCQFCSDNTFMPYSNASSCKSCDFMKESDANRTSCLNCQIGKYLKLYDFFSYSCLLCPNGSYSDTTNSSFCTTCSLGTFTRNTGESFCRNCPLGSSYSIGIELAEEANSQFVVKCNYCNLGKFSNSSNSVSDCSVCPEAKFSPSKGQSACEICSSGSYITGDFANCVKCSSGRFSFGNQTFCEACKPARFSTGEGYSFCTSCPEFMLSKEGSRSLQDCFCKAGYFGSVEFSTSDSNQCQVCPIVEGIFCPGNTTLPAIKQGYFFQLSDPLFPLKCYPEDACINSIYADTVCSDLYTGHACGSCIDYVSYRSFKRCQECSSRIFIGFSIFAVVSGFFFLQIKLLHPSFRFSAHIRIILSSLQILALYMRLLSNWPQNLYSFFISHYFVFQFQLRNICFRMLRFIQLLENLFGKGAFTTNRYPRFDSHKAVIKLSET